MSFQGGVFNLMASNKNKHLGARSEAFNNVQYVYLTLTLPFRLPLAVFARIIISLLIHEYASSTVECFMYIIMYQFKFIFRPCSSTFTSWSILAHFKRETALVLNAKFWKTVKSFQICFMSVYSDINLVISYNFQVCKYQFSLLYCPIISERVFPLFLWELAWVLARWHPKSVSCHYVITILVMVNGLYLLIWRFYASIMVPRHFTQYPSRTRGHR